jgi:RHS repeat-associated protein
LGTVRDIVNAAEVVIDHIDYDSFGRVLAETNAAFGDRFKFTGREYDEASGLYYYRACWYDPAIGRFLSADPLGFLAGDANLYRYVGNRPLTYFDPSGMSGDLLFYPAAIQYDLNVANASTASLSDNSWKIETCPRKHGHAIDFSCFPQQKLICLGGICSAAFFYWRESL